MPIVICIAAALLSGYVGHRKGYSFALYFATGLLLWPVILPVILLKKRNPETAPRDGLDALALRVSEGV